MTDPAPERLAISTIKEGDTLFPAAAERIWRAWWEGRGVALEDIERRLAGVVGSAEGEFGLAASLDGRFAGVCLAIHSDLDDRPDLSPWIAALWVDPEFRKRGIARELVMETLARCAAAGTEIVYLCAHRPLRNFYLAMGWRLIEHGVGAEELDLFDIRPAGAAPG